MCYIHLQQLILALYRCKQDLKDPPFSKGDGEDATSIQGAVVIMTQQRLIGWEKKAANVAHSPIGCDLDRPYIDSTLGRPRPEKANMGWVRPFQIVFSFMVDCIIPPNFVSHPKGLAASS